MLISTLSEFMARGSIYDFLHKQRGVFKIRTLLKVALDVSKGMNYLHQNNIIHRDLKTANLLMDENEVSIDLSFVQLNVLFVLSLEPALDVYSYLFLFSFWESLLSVIEIVDNLGLFILKE